ncbi:MAG TPA: hypothetical protein EYN26_00550 [Chromatiales bacterium]|nr:hypothetical protein [Chromatiales bacterium]HIO53620.1 hypothetical protein [Chromatiales bacterium]
MKDDSTADFSYRHLRSRHLPHQPIGTRDSRAALGTWQGLYLWEHRNGSFRRQITVTTLG